MDKKRRALKIIKKLNESHPNARTELVFSNPFEFIIAVVLSAQATDKSVNKVTRHLFKKYRSIEDYACAPLDELEKDISSINFYKTKAGRIKGIAKILLERFCGEIPATMEELVRIPGIGRKSANVILQEVGGIVEGIVVDTHVTRVSNRLKLVSHLKDAAKIEKDLMAIYPKKYWMDVGAQFVLHGRYVCKARSPKCDSCPIAKFCPSAFKF